MADWGLRADKTQKGNGFFGPLERPDGKISTELSIGVNIDGKDIEIPTLVPTLDQEEIDYLLGGGKPTETIINKAVEHARGRIKSGKSPFAEEGEQKPPTFSPKTNLKTEPQDKGTSFTDRLKSLMNPIDPFDWEMMTEEERQGIPLTPTQSMSPPQIEPPKEPKTWKERRFYETNAHKNPDQWIWINHKTHSDWYDKDIIKRARDIAIENGIDPYTFIAKGITESHLGNLHPDNPYRLDLRLHYPEILKMIERGEYNLEKGGREVSNAWKTQEIGTDAGRDIMMDYAAKHFKKGLNKYPKDELAGIQAYSGEGKTIYGGHPDVVRYHTGSTRSFGKPYQQIDFWKEKPQAKDTISVRNVIKDNPEVKSIVEPMATRQEGGHVEAGKKYVVGEKGPETFVPEESGEIIPAKETSFTDKLKSLLSGLSGSYGQYQQMAGKTKEDIKNIPYVGPTINKIADYLGNPEVTEATGTISGLMGVPLGFVGPEIVTPSIRAWGERAFPRLQQLVEKEAAVNKFAPEATEKTLVQIVPATPSFLSEYIPRKNIQRQSVISEDWLPWVSAHENLHVVKAQAAKQNPKGVQQALNELMEMAPKGLKNDFLRGVAPIIKETEEKFGITFPKSAIKDVLEDAASEELGATITSFLQGYGEEATKHGEQWMTFFNKAVKNDPKAVQKMTLFWKDFLKNPLTYGKQSGKALEFNLSDLITK